MAVSCDSFNAACLLQAPSAGNTTEETGSTKNGAETTLPTQETITTETGTDTPPVDLDAIIQEA